MLLNAKNSQVKIGNTNMDYIKFGKGKKVLVMLPGLGDGLVTVKGTALTMAFLYRCFAKDYTVYMFSRKNDMKAGYTTADMASDLKTAFDNLGIEKANLLGVSMGGMIAQHFAADYPQCVEKLILVATCAKLGEAYRSNINYWISLAQQKRHRKFMNSNMQLIYSPQYYRKNKPLLPVISLITKPKSYQRFLLQADACLTHDSTDKLSSITCPTFVIGGKQDLVVGGNASIEIAEKIKDSKLKMYNQWGHGLYDEAKDFLPTVAEFLKQ